METTLCINKFKDNCEEKQLFMIDGIESGMLFICKNSQGKQ